MKFRWWSVLLLAVPGTAVTWYLNRQGTYAGQLTLWIFGLALVSLVPLAAVIGEMTERLTAYWGEVGSGVINATFGNVPELAIGVFLLLHAGRHTGNEVVVASDFEIIRGLLLGSVINNVLLVLGISIFAGALRHGHLSFNADRASGYASMLALAVVGLALPTLSAAFARPGAEGAAAVEQTSVIVGIILLISYFAYIGSSVLGLGTRRGASEEETAAEAEARRARTARRATDRRGHVLTLVALLLVTGATVLVAALIVNVTDIVVQQTSLTPLSVGLILFPIACNVGEIAGAVGSAVRNRIEMTIAIASSSSVQVPLFVTPVLVFVALALSGGNSALLLTLVFQPLMLVVVGLCTFVYALVHLDGKTTWLEGLQLLAFYAMIAVTAFAVPGR